MTSRTAGDSEPCPIEDRLAPGRGTRQPARRAVLLGSEPRGPDGACGSSALERDVGPVVEQGLEAAVTEAIGLDPDAPPSGAGSERHPGGDRNPRSNATNEADRVANMEGRILSKAIRSRLLVSLCGALLVLAACDSASERADEGATAAAGSESSAAAEASWREFVAEAQRDLEGIERAFAQIPAELRAVGEDQIEHERELPRDPGQGVQGGARESRGAAGAARAELPRDRRRRPSAPRPPRREAHRIGWLEAFGLYAEPAVAG